MFKEMREAVASCTSIPLDTLLARLVTADLGTEVIERDLVPLHKLERPSSTTAADATSRNRRLGTAIDLQCAQVSEIDQIFGKVGVATASFQG